MRTRLIAAGLTTALAAGLLLVGAGAPAQAGDLDVRLSNTVEGMVHVEWDAAKGPGNTYAVQIATDRLIKTHVEQFSVPDGQTWLDVPHASLVTPASGDYTFVKVQIDRHGNGKNSGTPTAWIKPTPVVPPATGGKVEIATFNTRIWNANDKRGNKKTPTSWSVRRKKIAKVVRDTDPGVLLLQESSGAAKWRIAGKLWQFQDLAKRLPKKYTLSVNGLYTTPRKAVGSQGSRIIVDTSKFQVLSTGYVKPPAFSPAQVRWIPWVLLRDRVTAEEFYVASAHLQSGADKGSSHRLYDMRQRQTDFLHSQLSQFAATGRGVYVGGDFNSTSNTKPDNNVHRTLVADGWYDSFATTDVQGDNLPTTNDFVFPVKPGPFRRDYIMSLGAPQGSYSYVNHTYNAASQFQSDHFMQSAVLPVKPGPYLAAIELGSSKYKPYLR
jgi:endonuclease/exonuclease/phosphatase family metal-dependent hydrolase